MKESPAALVFLWRSGPLAREIPDISIPLAWNENSGMTTGGLLPFALMVVAGACVGRRTGQARMPPLERLHEGLGWWG